MISITFDDGWKNQYTQALPILERYGLKATFYIITRMPEYMFTEGQGRMSTDDILDAYNKGHEIGAHSQTHPHLQFSLPNKVIKEVIGSKNDLKDLGVQVDTFAYPYGRRNFFVDMVVRKNFKAGRLASGGIIDLTKNIKNESLTSLCIIAQDSFDKIKPVIDEAVNNKKWLILVFHQIENNPPQWGCEPNMFEKICNYIKEKNIHIVTISKGMDVVLQK